MMKKSNDSIFEKKLDSLFWFIIYLLPLILYVVSFLFKNDTLEVISFSSFIQSNFSFLESTIFFNLTTSLLDLLSIGSNSNYLVQFGVAYFVYCSLFHLFIDFMVWLPRYCHKLLNKDFLK